MAKVLLEKYDVVVFRGREKWGIVVGGKLLTLEKKGDHWVHSQEGFPDLEAVGTAAPSEFKAKLANDLREDIPEPIRLALGAVRQTLIMLEIEAKA